MKSYILECSQSNNSKQSKLQKIKGSQRINFCET